MVYLVEKLFHNSDLNLELTSYVDDKQNVCFRGKDIALILGYSKTRDALLRHVDSEDKQRTFTPHARVHKTGTVAPTGSLCTYINESGFYSLVLSSKYEAAKKFKHWVASQVLPSIHKYGQYKLFDNPYNKMIVIGNETDLHYKVVDMIRRFYPDTILVAGLGELQDAEDKRRDSYKKGYIKGQPDLLIINYHKDFKGLGIEFKSPKGNYYISDVQKEMKKRYVNNGYAYILCNDYDKICKAVHEYMKGIRVPFKYSNKLLLNKDTLETHYKVIHRIEK